MTQFTHIIKDEIGMHARPAGLLAKTAKPFASKITVTTHEKTVDATKLMALMTLGAKCGDELVIAADGGYDILKEKGYIIEDNNLIHFYDLFIEIYRFW